MIAELRTTDPPSSRMRTEPLNAQARAPRYSASRRRRPGKAGRGFYGADGGGKEKMEQEFQGRERGRGGGAPCPSSAAGPKTWKVERRGQKVSRVESWAPTVAPQIRALSSAPSPTGAGRSGCDRRPETGLAFRRPWAHGSGSESAGGQRAEVRAAPDRLPVGRGAGCRGSLPPGTGSVLGFGPPFPAGACAPGQPAGKRSLADVAPQPRSTEAVRKVRDSVPRACGDLGAAAPCVPRSPMDGTWDVASYKEGKRATPPHLEWRHLLALALKGAICSLLRIRAPKLCGRPGAVGQAFECTLRCFEQSAPRSLRKMGNSYAGQLKTTRFEEVLHNSIEASLRSSSLVPRPIFSQLYLEAERQLSSLEGGSRADNEEEEEEGEGALEPNGPANPYQMHPPPEGCCTMDGEYASLLEVPRCSEVWLGVPGFCQAGKDLRLASISSEPLEVPAGFLLVGAKSPSLPDHLLVCAVDQRFLPDDNGHNALLGFSGNCVGCGKKGFCYFTEFSNHINLKLTTQPKKQKHLKCYLVRNAQGALVQGPLICWKGSGPASDHPSLSTAMAPAVFNGKDSPKHQQLARNSLSVMPRPSALGHGNFPYLCGNLSDVVVSPLLYTCYQNSQSISRAYEQYGASTIQPISEEMQLLLTVYYLVQLAADQVPLMEDLEQIFLRSWRESHLTEIRQYQQAPPQPFPPTPGAVAPVTSAQLPWLAGLAASSCNDSVYIIECTYSLAEGLSEMFRLLIEGKLAKTNYVVIICACRNAAIDSCIAVTGYNLEPHCLRPFQLAVAQKLLSHVCSIADSSTQNLDLGSFEKVDFLICIPPSEVTYQQTLFHIWHSGVLLELGLEKEHLTKQRVEQYVLKLDAEAQTKFKSFLQNSFQNPHTLFILIHDHAHWDLVSSAVHNLYSQSDQSVGLVDRLFNCREVKEAPNIVTLHVTSFPYALQTQHTLISPYNEIHWPASYSNGVDLYPENKKYFGLSEFIESTLSGHSLPLLRYDSSFEAMVTALGKRFPRLHSAVIRTFVLVQHYAAAMMAVSGLSQMKNYTSVETLEITQNLINSPKQCPCGHGLMVLLRVPCSPLAAVAYERLAHVRARLALEEHFEIILGNPSSGITVGKHFVKQLKMWQKIEDAEWRPQTYLELEGLPCILIFSGMDPHGESLPRSLRYCDLRLINSSCLVRTALEQELGLAAYFVSNEAPLEKGSRNEALESDADKLSSTDNEDEEPGTEGSALCGEPSAQPGGPLPGEQARSPAPCGPSEEGRAPGERQRIRASRGAPPVINRHSPGLAPQPEYGLRSGQRSVQVSVPSSSSQLSSSGSSSSPTVPTSGPLVLQASQCALTKACQQPPVVFLPKLVYDMVTSTDSSGLPKAASLLPSHSVMWASSFRPLLSKTMTSTEQSLYYRQWTVPRPSHMDYGNRAEGRVDSFHPRRLLLSGPPQIGKTGAYLQFLSILSRMLIRLTEVDVYDEEEINSNLQGEADWHYLQLNDPWPDVELFKKMPFDYIIHDPKYEDASLICSHHQGIKSEDRGMSRKPEDLYVRRQTARMRLSKYAAYNTYHHCEQCHQYMGFHPRYQLYESTLHAFAFSYSMLGEEIQLHFIIPKSKEHHFVFSQPGGQLESMRLPLVTDKSHEYIKSPTFTPTTGRHEHGLFNLYHAMDGASHLHVLVVKEYEMAIYKKYWPNHIMLVLPSIFNSAGVGAAHFLIKELSYHNLELERNRQEELGIKPQDIWPFIVISDDSCVMWNVVDVDCSGERAREFSWSERNVSLKHIMQHIEAAPNITHYALIGLRKWSSKTGSREVREPFSRCHVHDFIVLNVDLTQNVQYNQNRFTCDDVDFNLRAHSAGLLLCRFNRFSVMKKQIAVGGHRSFHITSKVSDTPVATVPAQYICAPDSKHTFLAAPAQLLLEKFLQHHSHRFFPLSLKNLAHPVLSVDCYLNLGSQISVCYVSSRPHSLNISCADFMFSGLLLYLCDSFVGASFLKKFHFLKGATLCVICQDRNSLRQTVVRLELEDEWQFRLRDEFQTANAKEDRPLFFLTGRHI
ncbi:Protein GREB1 [Galemys pyrenaicus]|uniref:Protein GREB1 n=1 Tax=Galemys pyrenaicus TaxID=202257 RepID=A0A8J6AQ20_GALPY|nr:Protein GREB1 [Galemys pyrenaicus]